MKTISFFVGVLGLLVLAAAVIPAVPVAQENPDQKIEALQKQAAELEARVAALEKKIGDLTLMIPRQFPDFKQLPKGWEMREFNGMPYYIIPVNQDKKKDAGAVR